MLRRFDSQLINSDICVAGFYGRSGGVSKGFYDSLNTCMKSKEDPDNVRQNLKIISNDLGCENSNLKLVNQVHKVDVFVLDDATVVTASIPADAIVTKIKGVALGINTADCTPVLFFDPKNKVIGAAHAGWRSALGGVLQNTILNMEKLGADRANIVTCIGPTIAQESYEVDAEFKKQFLAQNVLNEKFFIPSKNDQHYMFDLPGYCSTQLQNAGVKSVENLGLDTYTNEEWFFSCRRSFHKEGENREFGGQLSVIMMR